MVSNSFCNTYAVWITVVIAVELSSICKDQHTGLHIYIIHITLHTFFITFKIQDKHTVPSLYSDSCRFTSRHYWYYTYKYNYIAGRKKNTHTLQIQQAVNYTFVYFLINTITLRNQSRSTYMSFLSTCHNYLYYCQAITSFSINPEQYSTQYVSIYVYKHALLFIILSLFLVCLYINIFRLRARWGYIYSINSVFFSLDQ